MNVVKYGEEFIKAIFTYCGIRDTCFWLPIICFEIPIIYFLFLKMCRRDLNKLRNIQMGRKPEDINAINRWLWDKPPIEPSILSQQQEAAAQQRQQQVIKF